MPSKLTARFAERFRGLERAHGIYDVPDKGTRGKKNVGRARTVKEGVTLARYEGHLLGKSGIGIIPVNDAAQCMFGAIDIDIYDLDLKKLEEAVRKAQLPLTVCRTKSGGAHLYLFASEPISADLIRSRLMEFAVCLGHPSVEVFPKQSELAGEDDVGSWINIPYFDSERTMRYAIKNGKALTLEEFLDHADTVAITEGNLRKIEIQEEEDLKDGPPCLQHLVKAGFPEGTRNKALFNLGVFCRAKFPDNWEEKLDEMNRKYMSPPLSTAEVQTTKKSLERKEYFFTCRDVPIVDACNRSICSKRKFGIGKFQNNDPGVALDGLTKICTKPPIWLINVDGRRLELASTEDLINQNRFVLSCVEAFNILPQTVKQPVWHELVRDLLGKVEEIDAPEDAGIEGQFYFLLEQFCTEQAHARNREELILGKPYSEDGYTYFRSGDLLQFLERRRMRMTPQEVWNLLREIKGRTKQFKIKNRSVRCWGVVQYVIDNEPLDVPHIEEEDF